ncbi:protein FolD [Seminavis robusta]|uniref:Protein FolD n=1 Tax=Seminavis robusta TaxID=568900 RepID=A0A9N8HUZ0_9STRA|nr:protein FolD [Seminavis robusta]|eukprot:Sro1716_g293170.1 protein FolD (400) ;mRNA; r:11615-12814
MTISALSNVCSGCSRLFLGSLVLLFSIPNGATAFTSPVSIVHRRPCHHFQPTLPSLCRHMVATDSDNNNINANDSVSSTTNDGPSTTIEEEYYAQDINGKKIAATIRQEIKEQVEDMMMQNNDNNHNHNHHPPGLAVMLVGSRRDSQTYVNMKTKACDQVGIASFQFSYPEDISHEQEVLEKVLELNQDPTVHGILIQLPLPAEWDQDAILQAVHPDKDVDGLHPVNVAKLWTNQQQDDFFPIPCTPLGCMELLQRSGIDVAGKHAVVLGRSHLVGLPLSRLLLQADATVTMVHSKTQHIDAVVRQGDIVIAAVGRAHMVQKEWLKKGAVVVDVGINAVDIPPKKPGGKAYKLVGDVDYAEARKVCSRITPVPGGVGPMTIAMLLRNTLQACQQQQQKQ